MESAHDLKKTKAQVKQGQGSGITSHSLSFKGRNRDPGARGTEQSHHTELLEASTEGSAGIGSRGSNRKSMVPLGSPRQDGLLPPRSR